MIKDILANQDTRTKALQEQKAQLETQANELNNTLLQEKNRYATLSTAYAIRVNTKPPVSTPSTPKPPVVPVVTPPPVVVTPPPVQNPPVVIPPRTTRAS